MTKKSLLPTGLIVTVFDHFFWRQKNLLNFGAKKITNCSDAATSRHFFRDFFHKKSRKNSQKSHRSPRFSQKPAREFCDFFSRKNRKKSIFRRQTGKKSNLFDFFPKKSKNRSRLSFLAPKNVILTPKWRHFCVKTHLQLILLKNCLAPLVKIAIFGVKKINT